MPEIWYRYYYVWRRSQSAAFSRALYMHYDELVANWNLLMTGKLREPLLNLDNFIQFALTDWTLKWYNSVDFAPEYLYENGKAA